MVHHPGHDTGEERFSHETCQVVRVMRRILVRLIITDRSMLMFIPNQVMSDIWLHAGSPTPLLAHLYRRLILNNVSSGLLGLLLESCKNHTPTKCQIWRVGLTRGWNQYRGQAGIYCQPNYFIQFGISLQILADQFAVVITSFNFLKLTDTNCPV